MIEYRSPKEKEFLLHYAKILGLKNIETILTKEKIESAIEAKELASFFWKMVDQTVIDSENGITVLGEKNLAVWCEDIMQSLRYHFIATGHMQIWDEESENA